MKLFNLYYILAEVPGVARGKKILIMKKHNILIFERKKFRFLKKIKNVAIFLDYITPMGSL